MMRGCRRPSRGMRRDRCRTFEYARRRRCWGFWVSMRAAVDGVVGKRTRSAVAMFRGNGSDTIDDALITALTSEVDRGRGNGLSEGRKAELAADERR